MLSNLLLDQFELQATVWVKLRRETDTKTMGDNKMDSVHQQIRHVAHFITRQQLSLEQIDSVVVHLLRVKCPMVKLDSLDSGDDEYWFDDEYDDDER